MGDTQDRIFKAWNDLAPRILSDRAELHRRLDRGFRQLRRAWPRPWCFAVRANDHRINEAIAIVVPEKARYPHLNGGAPQAHDVTFDKEALIRLCARFLLYPHGEPARDVAKKLGRSVRTLIHTRLNGTFSTWYVPGKWGNWTNPTPMLVRKTRLDPTMLGFRMPDAAWDWTGVAPGDGFMGEIAAQPMRRVPVYFDRTRRFKLEGVHPEDPRVDPPARKSLRLPPPPPDWVPYKWKDGVYMGYDWRKPWAKALYERQEHRRALMRKNNRTYRERRRERNSVARGSLEFKGWRWICPVCERPVKVLFHLLPARNVLRQYLPPMVEASVAALAAEAPHHAGFACWECHHVHNPSRGRRHFWGQIITYLTGGLLYGKEVPRPPEIKLERMRAYRPRMHAPAKRLEQVWELMTQGLTCRQIAEQLGMKEKTIKRYAYRLYKEKEVAPPKRVLKKEEIRDRLAAGQRYREIAEALGMKYQSVNAQVCKLRQEARQNVAGILNRGLTP